MRIVSNSPGRTRRIGEALGRLLNKGSVVALIGELGSGKTVLAQGLARGLDVDPDEYVSSPSFAIVNQYRGRVPIYHIDTYRLGSHLEMVSLGYEEYFEPDGVAIIEWADKVEELLPRTRLMVELKIVEQTVRDLSIELLGEWPAEVADAIEEAISGQAAETP